VESLSKKVLSSLLIIALLTLCCPWFVSENSKAAAATYLYPKTLATDGEKLYVATDQGLLVWNGKVFSEVKPPHSFILTIDALLHRTPISRVSLRELLFLGSIFLFSEINSPSLLNGFP